MSSGGLVGLAQFPSDDDAHEAARQLLEHGIGCDVAPGAGEGSSVVLVLAGDVKRAKRHLAIEKDAPAVPVAASGPAPDRAGTVGKSGGAGDVDETGGGGPSVAQSTEIASGAKGGTAAGASEKTVNADGEKVHQLLGGRIDATTRQIVIAGIIYLVALIAIPLIAFYGTRWAVDAGSDDTEPVPITLPE